MKVVTSLSGGMDSATVLAKLIDEGHEVSTIGFTYGSKHNSYEQKCALQLAKHYDVDYQLIDISNVMDLFESDLLKSGGDIPEGHYTDESMSATVVPGRNMIFITILAGYAWTLEASAVALGIHQGDHAIYPDCRRKFFLSINKSVRLGTDNRVNLIAPFIDTDKTGILKWGLTHKVPYGKTRTCYKDQKLSCGVCGSCVERLEAFEAMGELDHIQYDSKYYKALEKLDELAEDNDDSED